MATEIIVDSSIVIALVTDEKYSELTSKKILNAASSIS